MRRLGSGMVMAFINHEHSLQNIVVSPASEQARTSQFLSPTRCTHLQVARAGVRCAGAPVLGSGFSGVLEPPQPSLLAFMESRFFSQFWNGPFCAILEQSKPGISRLPTCGYVLELDLCPVCSITGHNFTFLFASIVNTLTMAMMMLFKRLPRLTRRVHIISIHHSCAGADLKFCGSNHW